MTEFRHAAARGRAAGRDVALGIAAGEFYLLG